MDPVTAKLMSAAGAAEEATYVDDVFSIDLYDGTGSAQTITNGIDLSGEGGLVWIKSRNNSYDHRLTDTERGLGKALESNTADAEATTAHCVNGSFNSNGFSLSSTGTPSAVNTSGDNICSWTFRKCPGFFDVVAYTGNGTAGRTIAHNLGSTPGMVVVKNSSTATTKWAVWHTSYGDNNRLYFNENTAGAANQTNHVRTASSTTFTVGSDYDVNHNGESYVAYIFANNDQSFGEDGDEAIIKCGSYTGNGGTQSINVGFEPQFLITKKSDGSGNWFIHDIMRKFSATGTNEAATLRVNSNAAEAANTARIHVNPTGFDFDAEGSDDVNSSNSNYIYVAIRRPHKPPETAAECFDVFSQTGSSSTQLRPGTSGSGVTDMAIIKNRGSATDWVLGARLLHGKNLIPNSNTSESTSKFGTSVNVWDQMSGTELQSGVSGTNFASTNYINYHFTRKAKFFDVVTYTGNGVQGRNITHNLGVAPELMIVKNRDTTNDKWHVYVSGITYLSVNGSDPDNYGNNPPTLFLNATDTPNFSMGGTWDHTHPTATTFRVGDTGGTNGNNEDLIAFLFASLAGVSKVGSYTGTGSDLNIDCGFTNGARFVLIKRVSGTTDWWLLDTARGINSGNDPAHYLNGDAAETSSYDLVDPYSAGFTAVADTAAINSSGETYIFLAIA